MKMSVVIATLNRPAELKNLLDSLMAQTRPADEILVIDQSTNNQSKIAVSQARTAHPAAAAGLRHVVQEEKSLVKARNRGLSLVSGDVVTFFDDDITLEPDYLEKVEARFASDPALGGLSGNASSKEWPSGAKWRLRRAIMRFFLLSGFDGRMTPSGFGYPVYERPIERDMEVEFLPGCNMNYRVASVGQDRFDEWFVGYGFREDVDFSYRMSRKAKLLMVPEAGLVHHYSVVNRLNEAELKKMEMRNYAYLFRKHRAGKPFARLLFGWSLLGLTVIDLIEFLSSRRAIKFDKLKAGVGSAFSYALRRLRA